MFRHIRSKLIAAFAVPLAILVAVAGLEALSSLGQISNVDQETALASASVGPGGVVQDLQAERGYAVLRVFQEAGTLPYALSGLSPQQGGYTQSATQLMLQTDAAKDSFESSVAHAGPEAVIAYKAAFQALTTLPTARAQWAGARAGHHVSGYTSVAQTTYEDYTAIIDALISGTATVPQHITDPTLRTGVEAMYASLQTTESQWTTLDDLFQAAWYTGSLQTSQILAAGQAWGSTQAWTQHLQSLGNGPYRSAVDTLTGTGSSTNAVNESPVTSALQLVISSLQLGLEAGGQRTGHGTVPSLAAVFNAFTEPAYSVLNTSLTTSNSATTSVLGNQEIANVVRDRAHNLHNNAVEQAVLFGLVGAIGTALGLVLVVLVSRSVSRPLVDLAHQAEELAHSTLPATVQSILDSSGSGEAPKVPKVRVHSRDEVAGMARALDAVNKTAVELAAGQAALRRNLADAFVNLGRRNQNLVTRQLEYISEIELKEADPESLEELFRLDHLATRMRRNAESLLILAGSGPARQWSAAVPAMDVARAASAEVEDYKRLRLHHFDQAQITGSVTTDLVHMLAELIENALSFSPPGSPVDIYGRFLEGGYVVVIVDSGIGMSEEDLEVANRRLQGLGSDDEIPGRYLGHFVAGRLAARHGIDISLQASHSGGLVARVKVPSELIEDPVPDLSAGAEVMTPATASRPVPAPPVGNGHSNGHGNGQAATGTEGTGPSAEAAPHSAAPEPAAAPAPASAAVAAPAPAPVPPSVQPRPLPVREIPSPVAELPSARAEAPRDDLSEKARPSAPSLAAPAAAASLADFYDDTEPEPPGAPAPLRDASPATRGPAVSAPPRNSLPDLGILSPLAATQAAEAELSPTSVLPMVAPTAVAAAAAPDPAPQSRVTADGLRRLTRRVPGASLPEESESLRRETPTSTTRNPLGVAGALSQYLSATNKENRPEKEHNAR